MDLPGQLLLPGFANAHSHAFQRALRGRTQQPSPEGADDFWSWRETMYEIALGVTPDAMRRIARMAFLDMVRAGITSVGEFHYLHHQPNGDPYANPNEMALQVVAAAEDVGIRIVLLRVLYARGDLDGRPPGPRQQRFVDPTIELALSRIEALSSACAEHPNATVGIAPHSVRACGLDWLRELDVWRGEQPAPVPCHMHLSEQTREVEDCVARHGLTPLRLVDANTQLVDPLFTAVHGTWFDDEDIACMATRGAMVCACPVTERDLGDGFLPAAELFAAGVGVCVGTDSHCQIDPFEEIRLIEMHERLRRRARIVLSSDQQPSPAQWLFDVGTSRGHAALGLEPSGLREGARFDAFSISLGHSSVLGCGDEALLPALVFAADPSAVHSVWVDGRRIVNAGRHEQQAEIERDYVACLQALRS